MRVMHVISGIDASLGGPVSALVGLARAQAASGVSVTVAPSLPQGEPPATVSQLQRASVDVQPIGPVTGSRGHHPEMESQLRPIVASSDVVHLYGLFEPIQSIAASVCRELNKPYIFEPCGMLDQWALRKRWLKKQLYLRLRLNKHLAGATALHAATSWERDQIALLNYRPPIVVVPIGVELAEFTTLPPRGSFRKIHPALDAGPVIMYLGRVFPGKGLEMIVPAMAKMKNRQVVLAVVGPDSNGYEAQIRAMAEAHGLAQRVIFTGMARGAERIAALVDADLFAAPSEHENFGVAVLEALAAGIPAVVSDQVGLCHDIVQAGAGEAVPLDIDRLAAALDRWISDDALRRQAGERARKLAFENFAWDLVAQKWNQVYRQLSIIN